LARFAIAIEIFLGLARYLLLLKTPQFSRLTSNIDISPFIPVAGATSTLIHENELCVVDWDQKYKRVPRGTKGWLLSHLVGVDQKLEALQPVADFVEKLLRNPLTADADTQVLFNSANQHSLFQMFATVAYLASNNILEGIQMSNFLEWVSAMGFLKQLSRFLQIESASVCAFRASLLRASVTTERFSRKTRHPEALHLLLSLDRRICSGRLGGELLHEIASADMTDEAGLLVFHGADIDFVQTLKHPPHNLGTPLCRAILFDAFDMARYLISAGCDVNKRFRTKAHDGEETALTMAIPLGNFGLVKELLNAGAKVDSDLRIKGYSIVEYVMMTSPRIYKLLQEKLGPGEISEVLQLIQEAEKGNRLLSRFLLEHNILHEEVLEQALCQAVKLGSRGAVRTLLQRGIDPNTRRSRLIGGTIKDTPPILLALTTSNDRTASDLFYLLMKAGANIDDEILMRICRSAIDTGYLNILHILAELGYNAALFGPSALEYGAYFGQIHDSGFFLDVGTPINVYGMKGRSCVQVAAREGNLPLVQYLIDRGADINLPASDDGGLTALQGAARGGHTEVVDYLIDTGAHVRAAPAKNIGVTVLEAAACPECDGEDWQLERKEGELVSTFKSLLALGAPVNRTNGTSGTVLHSLLRRSRIECVKLALQAGAQIEDREPSRPMSTPLQVAVAEGEMEAIQLLLEHGADVNAPAGAEFGRTTLQAATSAEKPDPDIIHLFLLHGADINAPPAMRGGVTALQGAAIRGDIQIAKMLLEHGADVNAAPALEEGRTAVEGAAEHGRLDMMRLLLRAGAKADPVLGFLRAIELAEENGHLALADLLRERERATSSCDEIMEFPAQPWLTQGMVFEEGLELST
jgi:ankyrin repeat protein